MANWHFDGFVPSVSKIKIVSTIKPIPGGDADAAPDREEESPDETN